MKQKLKIIVYLALATLVYSCAEEKDFVNERNRGKVKFEQKNFDELLKNPIFNEAYKKIINKEIVFTKSLEARTALEDEHGFSIDPEIIKIIETDDKIISYNMLITRDSLNGDFFENLVIRIDSLNNTDAFIIKYTPTDVLTKMDFHDSFKFVGNKEFTQIVTSGKMIWLENGCYILQVSLCWDVYPGQFSAPHVPGALCTNSAYIFTSNSEPICNNINFEGNGDPTGNSFSGGGGNNNNTIFNVIVPCRDCIEVDEYATEPCKDLKKMKSKQVMENDITRLKGNLHLKRETGSSISILPENIDLDIYTITPSISSKESCEGIRWDKDEFRIGINHTHTTLCKSYKMFSILDLYSLYQLYRDYSNQYYINTDVFFVNMIINGYVYSLKIDSANSGLFNGFNDMTQKKMDKMSKDLIYDYAYYGEPDDDIQNQITKAFLAKANLFGINLYRTPIGENKWEQLKLNPEISGGLQSIPCNN